MPPLQIRDFAPEDTEDVVALWTRCGLVRPQNDPRRDIERKQRVGDGGLLVGIDGDQIVATVMVGYEGHRGWINYLGVCPHHRLKGHGRAMLQEAERWLRSVGCPKVNLQVRTGNDAALAFYRALGYLPDQAVSLGKRLEFDA